MNLKWQHFWVYHGLPLYHKGKPNICFGPFDIGAPWPTISLAPDILYKLRHIFFRSSESSMRKFLRPGTSKHLLRQFNTGNAGSWGFHRSSADIRFNRCAEYFEISCQVFLKNYQTESVELSLQLMYFWMASAQEHLAANDYASAKVICVNNMLRWGYWSRGYWLCLFSPRYYPLKFAIFFWTQRMRRILGVHVKTKRSIFFWDFAIRFFRKMILTKS